MIQVHTEAVIKTNIEEVANINRFSGLQIGINQEDLEVCWIQAIIDRALKDYSFTDANQKSLIEHKLGANFAFRGNDILLIYAF